MTGSASTGERHFIIDEENPWPHLNSYDEAAQRFFNGRAEEAAALRRLVLYAPLTTLYSKSGLEKTSLLQAGLFPLLRKDRISPVYRGRDGGRRHGPVHYREEWESGETFLKHVRSEEFRRVLIALDMCCEEPRIVGGNLSGRSGMSPLLEMRENVWVRIAADGS